MKRKLRLTAVALAIVLFAGCGKSGDNKVASQVAAKVNGDEISVHQINFALARVGNIPPEQAKQATSQLLERMIDQQLLVQKAIENKLDRDPQIMQALEGARRQVLAQAYVDKSIASASKGSPEEIKKFYIENPALFERRRVYRFQELSVSIAPDSLGALRAEAEKARSMREIAGWLKSKDIKFSASATTRAAEQLPMELLPRLMQMKDGEITMIPGPAGASVVQLVQSQPAPFNEQQAVPMIEKFLLNRNRLELAESEVKNLRANAKIDYVGEFAAAKASSSSPSTPTAEPKPAAEANPDSMIERGLKGLN